MQIIRVGPSGGLADMCGVGRTHHRARRSPDSALPGFQQSEDFSTGTRHVVTGCASCMKSAATVSDQLLRFSSGSCVLVGRGFAPFPRVPTIIIHATGVDDTDGWQSFYMLSFF